MTAPELEEMISMVEQMRREIREIKAKQYGADGDRLWSFHQIARITGLDPKQVAMVLMSKHYIALCDAVFDSRLTIKDLNEFGLDIQVYIDLLRALWVDEQGEQLII
jgi:hypothetical protein